MAGRPVQKSNDLWRFKCYDPGGQGGIHDWYDNLPEDVQAEVDAALETLGNTRGEWPTVLHERLRGACYPLAEIKIEVDQDDLDDEARDIREGAGESEDRKNHYRILGFEGPGRREFTLLCGFKKENNSDYGPACRSAKQRREGVIKDGQRARPCNFP